MDELITLYLQSESHVNRLSSSLPRLCGNLDKLMNMYCIREVKQPRRGVGRNVTRHQRQTNNNVKLWTRTCLWRQTHTRANDR